MNTPRRAHRTAATAVLQFACMAAMMVACANVALSQSYHYEPVAGRTVGIWVDGWASGQLAVFKEQYGFNAALVTPYYKDYDSARAAGFPPSSLMMDVVADHYQAVVQQYEAGWYYIDEPVEHDCWGHASSGGPLFTPTELASRRDFIRQYRPGAKFVISGYKRCSHLRGAGPSCDIIMYASYQNWKKLTFSLCSPNMGWGDKREAGWYSSGGDQRPSWTDMRSVFGTKFGMTWVHGGGDEYDILLGHASNLGLNGVWVYHEGPIPSDKMEQFLAAAVKYGWLRRVDGPARRVAYASQQATLVDQQNVVVDWSTTWEIDIMRFQLERRAESGGDFAVVPGKEVQGKGTTLTPHPYSLTDNAVPAGGWWYRVVGISGDGTRFPSDPVHASVTGSAATDLMDRGLPVAENFPNPFNPTTEIRFSVPAPASADGQHGSSGSGWVTLKVYDILGREVAVLVDEKKEPGTYRVTFNASGLASGVYVYRLTAGSTTLTRRMLLTK
jgi:hypothetical protein